MTIAAPPEAPFDADRAASALEAGATNATASSAVSLNIRAIAARRSALGPAHLARELSLRCLRLRKLLETNRDSPPWARRCNGRLVPAELADGLALLSKRFSRITARLAPTDWVLRSPVRLSGD